MVWVDYRHENGKIKIDIFDSHDDSRGDAAGKAAGLANWARKHGPAFGRIELIRVVKGRIEPSVSDGVIADLKVQ